MDENIKCVAILMGLYKNDCPNAFEASLRSVFEQDNVKIYLFIHIDGPISKELNNVCDKFLNMGLLIFFVRSRVNVGLAVGLNKLIDEVCRVLPDIKYIARFDSDDICVKNRFTKQIEYLEVNEDIDVIGSSCYEFSHIPEKTNFLKKLPTTDVEIKKMLSHGCPFIHPTVMFRKNIFDKGIRYPENMRYSEDLGLWFLLRRSGVIFANLNEPLIYYRLTDQTIERRLGLKKGIDEFRLRIGNFKLKRDGFISLIFVSSRLFVHLLPLSIFKRLRKVYLSKYE